MRRILPLLLFFAMHLCAAEAQGNVWRVQEVFLGPEAEMTQQQASDWLDKRVRITQTAISFEGSTCRVTPEITRVQAGIFLAAQQITPQELGIEDGLVELVETGCDIPGLRTLLALADGRFVSFYKGAYIFLQKADSPPEEKQEVSLPESGISLELPASVRITSPWESPEQGLAFWYETAALHELHDGTYPFDARKALRDRAALAAASRGIDAAGILPTAALTTSQQLLDLPGNASSWGKSYTVLQDPPCTVRFVLVATIYHAGRVTQLGLAAAAAEVIQENPVYFTDNACQGGPAWAKDQGQAAFWSILRNERASGLAAEWHQVFSSMLENLRLFTPERFSFLDQEHTVCRKLPAEIFTSSLPGAQIVPGQTFSLVVPDAPAEAAALQDLCLLTLQQQGVQLQAVTTDERLLQVLDGPEGGETETKALGVADINEDGLPDIMSLATHTPPLGQPEPDNRIFFSQGSIRSLQSLHWLLSPTYSAAIRDKQDVAQSLAQARAMRRDLRLFIGLQFEGAGWLEEQFDTLVFVPESMPDFVDVPVRCVIFEPEQLPEAIREPGRRLWIKARVLQAEDMLRPPTLLLDILEHKSLDEPRVHFDFSFKGDDRTSWAPSELQP